jgi:hypothetical protein
MEALHEESRGARRDTGLRLTTRSAEGWKRLGACDGDLARVHPIMRLVSGGARRA